VDFRILGPLEVIHDGRAVPLPGARQRELLALLLLDAGRVISAERLMEDLWGEDQPSAGRTALRVRVSQLRKALPGGAELLVTRRGGYACRSSVMRWTCGGSSVTWPRGSGCSQAIRSARCDP